MSVTNSTNTNRLWSRRFFGKRSQRNPQKVNSLVYKDYTLVQGADGTKAYVSPEDKTQLLLEDKYASSEFSVRNEKRTSSRNSETDSDSGYEVPVKEKPKSCDGLNKKEEDETKRFGSMPFLGGGASPGDNGRINLPPYLVPLETSFGPHVVKRSAKKYKKRRSSPGDFDPKRRFPLREDFPAKRRASDAYGSSEHAGVGPIEPGKFSASEEGEVVADRSIRDEPAKESKSEEEIRSDEDREQAVDRPKTLDLEQPTEIFPETPTGKPPRGFSLPEFPPKRKERKSRGGKIDPNPLRKMFEIKRGRKEDEEGKPSRYGDADLSEIRSDTESADHGSADKSSVSKLTSEKQPKKLMSGLLGSFRKGRNKDKVADNESVRNPSSFEITIKEQPEDVGHGEAIRAEGIVYAELDMARSPGSVMRRDDEKTEYAEIIYPGSKLTVERATEELRKSRENLTSSRENLTEVDEAFSASPDGKKEAAV